MYIVMVLHTNACPKGYTRIFIAQAITIESGNATITSIASFFYFK